LQPSQTLLKTFTGEVVNVWGSLTVTVTYGEPQYTLDLLVIPGPEPSLFGRNWLQRIKIDWAQLYHI